MSSWADLTSALRDLHLACGRPTYESLSARTGLPKSAISYLIGRNPVQQPSETTVVRFVEGCLAHRRLVPADAAPLVERWRGVRARLTTDPAAGRPEERPAAPHVVAEPAPRRGSRARVLVGVAVLVAALLAAATALTAAGRVPVTGGPPSPSTSPSVSSPVVAAATPGGASAPATPAGPAGPRCVERAEPQTDTRTGREWRLVFYCANRRSPVFTWAQEDGKPISDLQSTDSWFVCWTRGRTSAGASAVFYYTQGDSTRRRADLDAWGFVPASAVLADEQPAPGLVRRCDFATSQDPARR